jgi:hypothetical protein
MRSRRTWCYTIDQPVTVRKKIYERTLETGEPQMMRPVEA